LGKCRTCAVEAVSQVALAEFFFAHLDERRRVKDHVTKKERRVAHIGTDALYLRHIALRYQTARTLGLFIADVWTEVVNVCHTPTVTKFSDRGNLLTTIRHDVIIREPIVVAA